MNDALLQIYQDSGLDPKGWLFFHKKEGWKVVFNLHELSHKKRRRTLSYLYKAGVEAISEKGIEEKKASSLLRMFWNEIAHDDIPEDLPGILAIDGFIRMFAEGRGVRLTFFRRLWKRLLEADKDEKSFFSPIEIGETFDGKLYYDVKASPPGFLAKLFSRFRLKRDPRLLARVQSDLIRASNIEDREKRNLVTLAILAHGASYRELDGKVLRIPSLTSPNSGTLIPYCFRHHLIWEGVKTISAFPVIGEERERGIYLCQGTEIWPSQPSMLGSIFANLGKEGSATEPYAHAWRQIHKHLRYLTRPLLPIVAGHSMGGSLVTQIALYSHPLIEKAYAFNPPAPARRDFEMYHSLSKEIQSKLHIYASIDDLPFWRIGTSVIGNVTCLLGEKRWKYRPLKKWELVLFFPGIYKIISNMMNALPAHQHIVPLLQTYVSFALSQEEIEKENEERVTRLDHIDFFPMLHSPAKNLLTFVRKYCGWELIDEYLRSQYEILELHEEDLKETLANEGGAEVSHQLEEVKKQKEEVLREILRRR